MVIGIVVAFCGIAYGLRRKEREHSAAAQAAVDNRQGAQYVKSEAASCGFMTLIMLVAVLSIAALFAVGAAS